MNKENILNDLPKSMEQLNALRKGSSSNRTNDISLEEFVKHKYGASNLDSFYKTIGIDPSKATLQSLVSMPEFTEGYRFLAPEVIREAVRLGLQKQPVYSGIIAAEENVATPTVIMPYINQSDATPKSVNEAETIGVGSISFGEKTVKIAKIGTGVKITDEVRQYVPLNILSLYLQDVGTRLNQKIDALAIDCLINGDQSNGSNAATVVGVDNIANGITYDKDLLRAWIKMGRLGKTPSTILSNEEAALKMLALPEFKGTNGYVAKAKLDVDTAIPNSQKYLIHGAMPTDNKIMLIDRTSAIVKLNASALRVESSRDAANQLDSTYITVTTGFANLFNDARLIIDGTQTLASKGYPSMFDVSVVEKF